MYSFKKYFLLANLCNKRLSFFMYLFFSGHEVTRLFTQLMSTSKLAAIYCPYTANDLRTGSLWWVWHEKQNRQSPAHNSLLRCTRESQTGEFILVIEG